MPEEINQFYDRIYCALDKLFVYPRTRGKGTPEIWTLEQKEQYVNYLKQNA